MTLFQRIVLLVVALTRGSAFCIGTIEYASKPWTLLTGFVLLAEILGATFLEARARSSIYRQLEHELPLAAASPTLRTDFAFGVLFSDNARGKPG